MRSTVAVCWLVCLAGVRCVAFTFADQQYAGAGDLSTGYFGNDRALLARRCLANCKLQLRQVAVEHFRGTATA